MNFNEYEIIVGNNSIIKNKSCNIIEISRKEIALIIDNERYYKIFHRDKIVKNEDILLFSNKIEEKVADLLPTKNFLKQEMIILSKKEKESMRKSSFLKIDKIEEDYEYGYFLDILEELDILDRVLITNESNIQDNQIGIFFIDQLDKIIKSISNAGLLSGINTDFNELRNIIYSEFSNRKFSEKEIYEIKEIFLLFSLDLSNSIKHIISKNKYEPNQDSALIHGGLIPTIYNIKEFFGLEISMDDEITFF